MHYPCAVRGDDLLGAYGAISVSRIQTDSTAGNWRWKRSILPRGFVAGQTRVEVVGPLAVEG